MALDDAQRGKAIINKAAPNDIATMNAVKIDPLAGRWHSRDRAETESARAADEGRGFVTCQRWRAISRKRGWSGCGEAGLDKLVFAWSGDLERGKRHHYRVQGPTFLIEHDNNAERRQPYSLRSGVISRRLRAGSAAEHLKTAAH